MSHDSLQPSFNRQSEVEALLAVDETVLGRVWGYLQEGLTPKAMAEREGTVGTGFVSNYNSLIAVLRDGRIPDSPSMAQAGARRVRSWLREKELTSALRAALTEQESLLTSRAEDKRAQAAEVAEAVKATVDAEASGTPGIYVYTLPHYLRYPVDAVTGKTLLKVGHSSTDAYYRAGSQGRLTALPEDPLLLRIYPVAASAAAERGFHEWLRDADHAPSRSRRGGSEWFLTSTKFLDRIARSNGLDVIVVNDLEVNEE
jgi:hypothetical protein